MIKEISFQANKNDYKNNNIKNSKKNSKLKTAVEISLLSVGTVAGIYYFAKHPIFKKNPTGNINGKFYDYGDFSGALKQPQTFESTKTEAVNDVFASSTHKTKPTWNAVTTKYTSEANTYGQSVTTEAADAPKNIEKLTPKTDNNTPKENSKEVVPGIIRQISKDIKEYILKCGISKNNNKINPAALDEILTKAVGEKKVKERPYIENKKVAKGRVKEYYSPNGKVYVLETHDSPKGVVTRLYMHEKDKHLRAYLHADGTFRLNAYTSEEAHFSTTAKGVRWMESSKFLTNNKGSK